MALYFPFEHLAYMLDLLFQVIRSFRLVVSMMLMVVVLGPETAKACSCNFDVMIWIGGAKAVEAQCQKRAIVFYEAWISGDEEDQQITRNTLCRNMREINRVPDCHLQRLSSCPGWFTSRVWLVAGSTLMLAEQQCGNPLYLLIVRG